MLFGRMIGLLNLFHRFHHFFGTNTGSVVSWRDGSNIYVAFQCDTCKKIDQKTIVNLNLKENNDNIEYSDS